MIQAKMNEMPKLDILGLCKVPKSERKQDLVGTSDQRTDKGKRYRILYGRNQTVEGGACMWQEATQHQTLEPSSWIN